MPLPSQHELDDLEPLVPVSLYFWVHEYVADTSMHLPPHGKLASVEPELQAAMTALAEANGVSTGGRREETASALLLKLHEFAQGLKDVQEMRLAFDEGKTVAAAASRLKNKSRQSSSGRSMTRNGLYFRCETVGLSTAQFQRKPRRDTWELMKASTILGGVARALESCAATAAGKKILDLGPFE